MASFRGLCNAAISASLKALNLATSPRTWSQKSEVATGFSALQRKITKKP